MYLSQSWLVCYTLPVKKIMLTTGWARKSWVMCSQAGLLYLIFTGMSINKPSLLPLLGFIVSYNVLEANVSVNKMKDTNLGTTYPTTTAPLSNKALMHHS